MTTLGGGKRSITRKQVITTKPLNSRISVEVDAAFHCSILVLMTA